MVYYVFKLVKNIGNPYPLGTIFLAFITGQAVPDNGGILCQFGLPQNKGMDDLVGC
jgi:hypothetical protein